MTNDENRGPAIADANLGAGELEGAVVIFDLDGTLVDTANDLGASMNHVLTANGHDPVPVDEVRHLTGRGARVMLERGFSLVAGAAPPAAAMDDYLLQFLEHYESHIAVESHSYPGAIDAVAALRSAGAKTAICTNKREKLARLLFSALDLERHFDVIVGADTTYARKPDPAPVRLCLELTKTTQGVFIGDSDTDLAAATAAGVPCIIAEFGYGPLETADQKTVCFGTYRELPDLVRRILGVAA